MGQPRAKPKYLADKLLAIRQGRKLSQLKMARLLKIPPSSSRISQYETGLREPNLMVILAYARAGDVTVEQLIDDDLDLYDF
jgi:transcriptional regulator with XRE-family HTH domain